MKKLLLIPVLLLFAASASFAQSVKNVPAQYDPSTMLPVPDVLVNEIIADTSATGEQLHDVYMLELNQTYTLTQSMVVNNPIKITAPEFDRTDVNKKPPVVRIDVLEDGVTQACAAACIWFLAGADLELENIYFGGQHMGNGWTNGNLLQATKAGVVVRFDNLIIDYMGWSVISQFDASIENVSYYFDDVYVKNAQNAGDLNSPFLILNIGPPIDVLSVRNTTYFQSHGFMIQSRTPINKFIMDHVTVANALKSPIYNLQLTDAEITNNIFYNIEAGGFNEAERADQDPDGLFWGAVSADTLAGNEAGGAGGRMAEADRSIIVKNNVFYRTPALSEFAADSLVMGDFMNSRTQAMFDDDATWPGLVEENNHTMAFEFTNLTEPGTGGWEATAEMINYITSFRSGTGVFNWGFENDHDQYGEFATIVVDWPRTEDLSHNITSVTDDGGYPVGDLNWYPQFVGVANEEAPELPSGIELHQNYPNPFNPTTEITFSLDNSSNVTLEVYNVLGQRVATLMDSQNLSAGLHSASFHASDLTSGVYVYRLSTDSQATISKKMLLLK